MAPRKTPAPFVVFDNVVVMAAKKADETTWRSVVGTMEVALERIGAIADGLRTKLGSHDDSVDHDIRRVANRVLREAAEDPGSMYTRVAVAEDPAPTIEARAPKFGFLAVRRDLRLPCWKKAHAKLWIKGMEDMAKKLSKLQDDVVYRLKHGGKKISGGVCDATLRDLTARVIIDLWEGDAAKDDCGGVELPLADPHDKIQAIRRKRKPNLSQNKKTETPRKRKAAGEAEEPPSPKKRRNADESM